MSSVFLCTARRMLRLAVLRDRVKQPFARLVDRHAAQLRARHREMASAAERLHDDLNVEITHAARGNADLAAGIDGHKARLHAVDGQQVVRRLRNHDVHVLGQFIGHDHRAAHVQLRVGDELRAVCVALQRRVEQFFDGLRLGAHTAQIRSRFKRPHTRVQREIARVQRDAGQQRLRFTAVSRVSLSDGIYWINSVTSSEALDALVS